MSNITFNPSLQTGTLGTTPDSTTPKPVVQTPQPVAATTQPTSDNVALSPGAQTVLAATATPATPLSESDATAQSVSLRQQLGASQLSGTARQNQAIVALLR